MHYRAYLFSLLLALAPFPNLSAAPSSKGQAARAQPPAATQLSATAQPPPAAPQTTARAFLLQDFNSGYLLAQSNAEEHTEPASLTKLMTAYLVFKELAVGNIKLNDPVSISERAWRTPGSRTFVKLHSKVPLEDLVKGMIAQSGNDATLALAEHVAGSEESFVTLMNREAQRLGMDNTHFTNSTGLPDPQLYITAHDVGRLVRALIHDYPQYYKYYSTKEFTYNGITQYNRNKLLWRDPSVDGVKTGHTETAGYSLVASALREGMRLISVVLGTKSENIRAQESQELLNYGFRFFETHRLYAAGKPLSTVRVWKGASKTLPLGLSRDFYITVPRGQYKNLAAAMEVDQAILAPTAKGQPHGKLKISLGKRVIAERPLLALQNVPPGGLWRRMVDSVLLRLQ